MVANINCNSIDLNMMIKIILEMLIEIYKEYKLNTLYHTIHTYSSFTPSVNELLITSARLRKVKEIIKDYHTQQNYIISMNKLALYSEYSNPIQNHSPKSKTYIKINPTSLQSALSKLKPTTPNPKPIKTEATLLFNLDMLKRVNNNT